MCSLRAAFARILLPPIVLAEMNTYYFIAAHPGCTESDMRELKRFAERELNLRPEQVQIFTPTPLTAATCMYYTGIDPVSGRKVYVSRGLGEKQRQKDVLTPRQRRAY